jgi:hypothetical protein
VKIIKQAIAFLASNKIRQIGSTLCQMMKEEVGRDLPKDLIVRLLRPTGKTRNLA